MVNSPVPSPPAEKTAILAGVHAAVANSPFESVLQNASAPQIPVGVAPAPAVAPLLSQYSDWARIGRVPAETRSSAGNTNFETGALRRRRLIRVWKRMVFSLSLMRFEWTGNTADEPG